MPSQPASTGQPLGGVVAVISGTFSKGRPHAKIKDIVTGLGGTVLRSITAETTHVISTPTDASGPSLKVRTALNLAQPAKIVSLDWLEECLSQNSFLDENSYFLGASSAGVPPQTSAVDSSATLGSPTDPPDGQPAPRRSRRVAASDAQPPVVAAATPPPTLDSTSVPRRRGRAEKAIPDANGDEKENTSLQAPLTDGQTLAPTKKRRVSAKSEDPGVPSAVDSTDQKKPARTTRTKGKNAAKVKTEESEGEDEEEEKEEPLKEDDINTTHDKKQNVTIAKTKTSADVHPEPTTDTTIKPDPHSGPKPIIVPLDPECTKTGWQVYVDPHTNEIFDVSLNQTNAGNNNNKFYLIQVITDGNWLYFTWTRYGRVGERGQKGLLGNGTLDDAIRQFKKKFRDKSGLDWENRWGEPKRGKYVYIERNYEPSDDEDDSSEKVKAENNAEPDIYKPPESKLDPAIRDLMGLIFNTALFQSTFQELNYDSEKLPLGKLGRFTITRGFETLKQLASVFTSTNVSAYQIEELSNRYYSLIPHAFGRSRPPIISSIQMLKKEVDLLESLSDMKAASEIMKLSQKAADSDPLVHSADKQFAALGLDEMVPLDRASPEFAQLLSYLDNTRGGTHSIKYKVENIFRICRAGEPGQFIKEEQFPTVLQSPSDSTAPASHRRLLWHGSRCTNYGGILSQGLRIAPPEAPVSGYMFGKGVYLADMSSKSANYCCSRISQDTGLLLLCEAELGDPMLELTGADYHAGERAQREGKLATWGKGRFAPTKWKDAAELHEDLAGVMMPDVESEKPGDTNTPEASLWYNEYICYNVTQIRMRYLFRVKMNY